MDTKKFIKNKEDFVCNHCGYSVEGNGYTNHCPNCLWSMHVDINPGDRACDCSGMMKPVALVNKGNVFHIKHKCERCSFERNNKAVKGDNFNELVKLSSQD
jgi:anaerobic ribonucleoside-triphosphate reductase